MAKKRTYYKKKESIFTPYKQNIQDYPFTVKKRSNAETDWNREGNGLPIIGDISNRSGWDTGMGERFAFTNRNYPVEPTEIDLFEGSVDTGLIDMDVVVAGGLLILSIAALFYAKNKPTTL